MINPKSFIDTLNLYGIDFFTGVPDSLLKNICAYISESIDEHHNIIAANEGAAIGLAAGYHLATSKVGVVYMQNSGEGNIINPLASLTDRDVYNIPILLLIGWRGRPGVHDEPQHKKQGKITTGLLNIMGIDYDILSKDNDKAIIQIANAVEALKRNEVYALIIEKDTFEEYQPQKVEVNNFSMTREEAIRNIVSIIGEKDVVVSTTGMISRELFEIRENSGHSHNQDFLTVGSMGHASQIALGIALEKNDRTIWCFDGDGSMLMHMGSMAIIANRAPANYVHVIFNNGAHDSVGGQPTVGLMIDIPAIAKAVGYKAAFTVDNKDALDLVLNEVTSMIETKSPVLLEVKVRKGNRANLGRPTTSPIQNKEALMKFLGK